MDFYSDDKRIVLHLIDKIRPLPGFVKKASIIDKETIPENRFADVANQRFPAYDPASTYLSYCYYCMNRDKLPPAIGENLVKSALFFGVADDIKEFTKRFVDAKKHLTKKAEAATYAIPERKQFPLATPEQVLLASDHFDRNHRHYGIPDRVRISQGIIKKANEFGLPVSSTVVVQYSNFQPICRSDKATAGILARSLMGNLTKQAQQAYLQIGNGLSGNAGNYETLLGVTEALEHLDRATGVNRHYGRGVASPIETVFNTMAKTAMAQVDIVKLGNDEYLLNDFLKIPEEVYSDAFGDDFLEQVQSATGELDKEKLRQIIPTLPADERNLLKRYLDQYATALTEESPDDENLL